jgi:hypothetical protein
MKKQKRMPTVLELRRGEDRGRKEAGLYSRARKNLSSV